LGAVAGGGIGQIQPSIALAAAAAVQVRLGQGDLCVVVAVQAKGQGSGLGVEGGDGAAAGVGHPQLPNRVVAAHDPVLHGQLAVLDPKPLPSEAAAGGQQLLAGAVEPVDLGPPGGHHHHLVGWVVFGLLPGRPPVLQQRQGGGGLGVGGHHPIVGLVGRDGLVDQAGSDEVEGFAFPRLVLAAVLHQLTGPEAESYRQELWIDFSA